MKTIICAISIFSILIVIAPAYKSNSSSSLDESIVRAFADPAKDKIFENSLSAKILFCTERI